MVNKDIIKTSEDEEVVLHSKKIGVAFYADHKKDDAKSRIFQFLRGKRKTEKTQKFVWPLKSITFDGYQGEILGIIGSNGAGKTTLCKVVSGIIKADRGLMDVDGRVSALFSFGMGFNKELSGRENVYLNGMMLGIEKKTIRHYIDSIHEFSEIGDFFDQPMKYYSSGMKARLGFSVAAHLEPEILILDEALNTGDVAFSQKAAEKMKELVKKAKMVIIVTHSLKYAEENCDRLIWIKDGIVVDDGSPQKVLENYKSSVPVLPKKKKKSLDLKKTEARMSNKTVIRAKNLSVLFKLGRRKEFWALKDLNFEIKEGEVIGIIGHNGAGKSTLCKVLTNILKPDEGSITVDGETTALLSYGTGFSPQITGADNIYLNGMLLGIPRERIRKKYNEIVEFSGLGKAIDKPIKSYSSGMKSRLGFSIAATLQPDIFILDEALSTGDAEFRQKASEKIQDMIEKAKAVIIVSHSMSFVNKICTRAIWMEHGKIIFDGDPKQATKKYKAKVKKK